MAKNEENEDARIARSSRGFKISEDEDLKRSKIEDLKIEDRGFKKIEDLKIKLIKGSQNMIVNFKLF